MSTSKEIRSIREGIGLSQDGFAALVGVSSATVFFWEAGRTRPSPLAREKLLCVKRAAGEIKKAGAKEERAADSEIAP